MSKFVQAPKELQDLLASYGAVMKPDMADLETLAAMLHANPELRVNEDWGKPEHMRLLLRHRPDLLKRLPDPTPWWSQAIPNDANFAHWLLAQGLDPNRSNWLGITMLHRCAAKGAIAIAQVFLDAGADIDAVETDSACTPLAAAARAGQKQMVECLLAKAAKPGGPEDEEWARPVEWARRRGREDIVAVLDRG